MLSWRRAARGNQTGVSGMARIHTASALSMLPVCILYLVFNRKSMEGMTSGSVKGWV